MHIAAITTCYGEMQSKLRYKRTNKSGTTALCWTNLPDSGTQKENTALPRCIATARHDSKDLPDIHAPLSDKPRRQGSKMSTK